MHLRISSEKWRPFCPGGDELRFHSNHPATNELISIEMHHSHLLGHVIQRNQMHFTPLSLIGIISFSSSSVTLSSKATQTRSRTPAFWGYPLLCHGYPHYSLILDPKWKDKIKVTILKNLPKIQIFEFWREKKTFQVIHSLLLDKMSKYEMDLASIVEDTERTRFHPQTDRWTDGQVETSIPPFQHSLSGGIKRTRGLSVYIAPLHIQIMMTKVWKVSQLP